MASDSDTCAVCGDGLLPGQRLTTAADAHLSCSPTEAHAAEAVAALIALLTVGPAKPEHRCMGKRCQRVARYAVTALDEGMGAHEFPVRLCQSCLTALDADGHPVDTFRWLSDNRIEANT